MPNILLVEDNEMNRDMLSRRLIRRGFSVTLAEDAEQALQIAASELPELILMDVGLPDIDGWEATRRLKSSERTRYIPVIALTAHALSTDREQAMAAGCDGYETKPVDFPRLLSRMDALIGRVKQP